jgi:hypothetical protein
MNEKSHKTKQAMYQ